MSNPQTIARLYCLNWQGEGDCSGIDFQFDGSLVRFRPEGCQCLLKTKERCAYFEKVVLPQSKGWQDANPGPAREFGEARDQYFRMHSGISGLRLKSRKCSRCANPIGPKQRFCAECRPKE